MLLHQSPDEVHPFTAVLCRLGDLEREVPKSVHMWAQAYANNLVDHHLVLDLVPAMAGAYFARRLPVPLMHTQAAILAGLGLQRCDVSALEVALGLPAGQVLALFNKVRCVLGVCWVCGSLVGACSA